MTPDQEKLLKDTHETVLGIHQLLTGFNGSDGLCKEFENHKAEDKTFRKEFYAFRTRIYVLIALAAGAASG